jgi:hypothetical protein
MIGRSEESDGVVGVEFGAPALQANGRRMLAAQPSNKAETRFEINAAAPKKTHHPSSPPSISKMSSIIPSSYKSHSSFVIPLIAIQLSPSSCLP